MGILNNILESIPDTLTIATTPKEVIFHSCPTSNSYVNVLIISIAVVICFAIVAIVGGLSYRSSCISKRLEINNKQEAEKSRREKDLLEKENKDRLDLASRYLEKFYKKEQEGKELSECEKKMKDVSLTYLTNFIKDNNPEESNPANKN